MTDPRDKDERGGETSDKDKPWWAEAMRDLTSAGIATIFMTEESVRNYLKEKKLPKELISVFLEGVYKKKDDVFGVFSKEIAKMFSKIDLSREISRFLETHNVHLEAKVSFKPKNGSNVSTTEIEIEKEES